MENSKEETISDMIIQYLTDHPDAADTLGGITQWWLEFGRIEISVREVESVVNGLIKQGLVAVYQIDGGTNIYTLRKNS